MNHDLTTGNITKSLLRFAFPIMVGNLLQQLYNIVDTIIVGRFLGRDALAAVGSAYTLMTFLTSIILGLCMGSGVAFSICIGRKELEKLRASLFHSLCMIGAVTVLLMAIVFLGLDEILYLLRVPAELYEMMKTYLWVIFWGIAATFFYNYFGSLLRAAGNSFVPLLFLGVSAVVNIGLDLLFVIGFQRGVRGAAEATVLSQYLSGIGIFLYTWICFPEFRLNRQAVKWRPKILNELVHLSFLTCVQQSVMNFGILMVQGLVNSFGAAVMAAFSAAVKIDSFAYMPVQDFGNAFSTFIAQNYGAGKQKRIQQGVRSAVRTSFLFSVAVSAAVVIFARPLMRIFVKATEADVLQIGVNYLRIEGTFYCLIGFLFLFYGYFRAVTKPGISLVLTIISLGTRVLLAYALSAVPSIGVNGIWAAVPIGWFLADVSGYLYYRKNKTLQIQKDS